MIPPIGVEVKPLGIVNAQGARAKASSSAAFHRGWCRRNNDVTISSVATIAMHRAEMAKIMTRIVSNILCPTELTTKNNTLVSVVRLDTFNY
jgi:hypothetical protein